jgi:hypothetical protein
MTALIVPAIATSPAAINLNPQVLVVWLCVGLIGLVAGAIAVRIAQRRLATTRLALNGVREMYVPEQSADQTIKRAA